MQSLRKIIQLKNQQNSFSNKSNGIIVNPNSAKFSDLVLKNFKCFPATLHNKKEYEDKAKKKRISQSAIKNNKEIDNLMNIRQLLSTDNRKLNSAYTTNLIDEHGPIHISSMTTPQSILKPISNSQGKKLTLSQDLKGNTEALNKILKKLKGKLDTYKERKSLLITSNETLKEEVKRLNGLLNLQNNKYIGLSFIIIY